MFSSLSASLPSNRELWFWTLGQIFIFYRNCSKHPELNTSFTLSLSLTHTQTHTHARARAHTHTHTYSVYCPSLHGDMPGFHIREPASPLPSRKVSWKPAETFLRPVRSWQLKLFNQHGDVISCSWCAWSFQEPRTL